MTYIWKNKTQKLRESSLHVKKLLHSVKAHGNQYCQTMVGMKPHSVSCNAFKTVVALGTSKTEAYSLPTFTTTKH